MFSRDIPKATNSRARSDPTRCTSVHVDTKAAFRAAVTRARTTEQPPTAQTLAAVSISGPDPRTKEARSKRTTWFKRRDTSLVLRDAPRALAVPTLREEQRSMRECEIWVTTERMKRAEGRSWLKTR